MTRTDALSARYIAQRSAQDADQVEYRAFTEGQATMDDGLMDERIAGAMDDFDSIDATPHGENDLDWAREDLRQDDAVGKILSIVERRLELMGEHYALKLDGGSLSYEGSSTSIYEFCLAITQVDVREHPNLPRVFEQVSRLLVERFLGEGGASHHTGWPRPSNQSGFKAAMQPVHERTGEWVWNPQDGLPDDPAPQYCKDEGVDFITWRANPDGRPGHLFLIGQCACGENWDTKFNDVDLEKLRRWFHPMSLIPPVRVFCTPFHVTDAMIREASRSAGIVFDRIRLALLAETAPEDAQQAIKAQLAGWDSTSPDIR